MGCNCKSGASSTSTSSTQKTESSSVVQTFFKYSAKIMGFLIGVLLLPFIMLGVIWFMFDTIVLNKEVDLTLILKKIVKINKVVFQDDDEEEDDDYEDYEDLDDDEIGYITENVEEIK